MKKSVIAVIFAIFLCTFQISAKEIRVAVTDFDGGNHFRAYGETVTGIVIAELSGEKNIQVIERGQLKKVMDEHSLALTGLVDPDKAAELGKFIPLNKLVSGTIGPLGNQFVITVRMIDIETSKIDVAVTETVPNANGLSVGAKVVADKLINAIKSGGAARESKRERLKYGCESKNDATDCYNLGVMWYRGEEGLKNQIFAKNHFMAACSFGHARACYYSGNMFKNGVGGSKDSKNAATYFKAACDSGFKKGCNQVSSQKKGGSAFGDPLVSGNDNQSVAIPGKKNSSKKEELIPELEK
jgi:hypothetical protein